LPYLLGTIDAAFVQLAGITLSLNSDLTLPYSFCAIDAAYAQLVALGTKDQIQFYASRTVVEVDPTNRFY